LAIAARDWGTDHTLPSKVHIELRHGFHLKNV
jgi:hypothetical protein